MEKLPKQFNQIKTRGVRIKIKGFLRNADTWEKIRATLLFVFIPPIVVSFLLNMILFLFSSYVLSQTQFLGVFLATFMIMGLVFLYWGWYRTFNGWILFDKDNEILFVLVDKKFPTLLEIPYEEIIGIQWVGGKNGYAKIETPVGSFPTERASEKKEGSVTELWEDLASIGAPFEDWPITLWCPSCNRSFGHHLGTAVCPFDPETALIDLETKGRHDPQGISPEDLDRV
ncbi:MAG: hypothetical protein D6732_27130 [Methanobacteriota archaeon]|nr:MAG: hypothetical protein D6732_27130 [Euryarchaeota archaeon]